MILRRWLGIDLYRYFEGYGLQQKSFNLQAENHKTVLEFHNKFASVISVSVIGRSLLLWIGLKLYDKWRMIIV